MCGRTKCFTKSVVLLLAILIVIAGPALLTGEPGEQYEWVALSAQRFPLIFSFGLRKPIWRADSAYVAIWVASPRYRGLSDLVILDTKTGKPVATLPVDLDRRSQSRPYTYDPKIHGLTKVRIAAYKWQGEDELVYLNSDGELLLGNIKTSSCTKLSQIKGFKWGRACFSEKLPIVYYSIVDNGVISLLALNYATNKTQLIWTSKGSLIPYCVWDSGVDYLTELPEQRALLFIIAARWENGPCESLLHVVPLEKREQPTIVSMNVPLTRVEFAQIDREQNILWLLHRDTTGPDSDIDVETFYKYDLRGQKLLEAKSLTFVDERITDWQYLPKRKLHVLNIWGCVVDHGEDEDGTIVIRYRKTWGRICLYDASFTKVMASLTVEEDEIPVSGPFSPCENYVIGQPDPWHAIIYRFQRKPN